MHQSNHFLSPRSCFKELKATDPGLLEFIDQASVAAGPYFQWKQDPAISTPRILVAEIKGANLLVLPLMQILVSKKLPINPSCPKLERESWIGRLSPEVRSIDLLFQFQNPILLIRTLGKSLLLRKIFWKSYAKNLKTTTLQSFIFSRPQRRTSKKTVSTTSKK